MSEQALTIAIFRGTQRGFSFHAYLIEVGLLLALLVKQKQLVVH